MRTGNNQEAINTAKDWLKRPYAFPGGYSKRLYLSDGETLCRDCALENWGSIVDSTRNELRDGWAIMGVDVHWEGPADYCAQCSTEMPSEYGDPDEKGGE